MALVVKSALPLEKME